MIIEISAALIALAFVVLVLYTVQTLKSARSSLDQANRTLAQIQQQLNEVNVEAVKLLQHTNQMTADVQNKIKSADSLFQSIHQAGEAVHKVTSSVKQVSATFSQSLVDNVQRVAHKNRSTTAEVTEWATLAMGLWHKWQAHRNANTSLVESNQSKEGEDHNVKK